MSAAISHDGVRTCNPHSDPPSASTSLLDRLRARNPLAWQWFEDIYGPVIESRLRGWGLQHADAADVRQIILTAVNRGIGSFRRDRPGDSFRGWLWTITRHEFYQHIRRSRGEAQGEGGTHAQQRLAQVPDLPPDGDGSVQEDGALRELVGRGMESVRSEFEPHTWQAFWRHTVDGQSAADVAAELGMTVAAVWKAASRVKKRIREELEGFLE